MGGGLAMWRWQSLCCYENYEMNGRDSPPKCRGAGQIDEHSADS
jgi:hypothetical protein